MATKKYNENKEKQIIYLVGTVIIVLIVIFVAFSSSKDNNTEEINVDETEVVNEAQTQIDNDTIAKLKKMEERDRMEYYFSAFMDYIDSGDYEEAYNLLYSEFKENYFPTLESFEEYAKTTFPEMVDVEHENIERNGDVYVLWINIKDTINGSPNDEAKQMNFVIREDDYNDFVMSFSV